MMSPTARLHQHQFSLRILSANQLSPMAGRHRNIPVWRQKLSVAEMSCDLHMKGRIFWKSGGLHAIISLLLNAPPDYKREGLAKPLYSILGEQEMLPSLVGHWKGAKITRKAQQREGLAAKSTPPVPRGSYFTQGMPHAKGRVCFCRCVAYFQKQLFFLSRTQPASYRVYICRLLFTPDIMNAPF